MYFHHSYHIILETLILNKNLNTMTATTVVFKLHVDNI